MGAAKWWRKGRLGLLVLAAAGAALLSGCGGMTVGTTWSPDNQHLRTAPARTD